MKILLVEESPADAVLVGALLDTTAEAYEVRHCRGLQAALQALDVEMPDVVLLDIGSSAERNAWQALNEKAPAIPVLMLVEGVDQRLALQALEHGAQYHLIKNHLDAESLQGAIRYAVRRKSFERTTAESMQCDRVTGLTNRAHFLQMLRHVLAGAMRTGATTALLLINLDRFKQVNDGVGYEAGDELLKQVAERLLSCRREADALARLGADEFALLLEHVDEPASAAKVADKILHSMLPLFDIGDMHVSMSPSIGIAMVSGAGSDADVLLGQANAAMYQAKASGGSGYRFYLDAMQTASRYSLELEARLRRAVEQVEFELHYQPIIDLASYRVVAAEALIRWRQSKTSDLFPAKEFLPILEKMPMNREVGLWTLRQACAQARSWRNTLNAELRICVNVTTRQLLDADFVRQLTAVLRETRLDAKALELEISENVLMGNDLTTAIETLKQIKAIGVAIAIDDFGVGYSSLGRLTAFPFDTVKLDQRFLQEIPASTDAALVIAGVLSIAKGLGRRVVAEGIETMTQLGFLAQHGCDEAQGYFCSPALTAEAFQPFCEQWTPLPESPHIPRTHIAPQRAIKNYLDTALDPD